jgi:hypothetical protein
MSEAGLGTQLPSPVVAGECLPADDFSGGTIQSELRSRIRPPAISAIDRERERVRGRIRQAQADGGEVWDLLPGVCKQLLQSVEVRIFRAVRTVFRVLAGIPAAFWKDLSCRWWWLILRHAVKQIVRPRIRHDYAGDHNQKQRYDTPESENVMPVPIAREPTLRRETA